MLCIDVGGPKKIGWADCIGVTGTGGDLGDALDRLAAMKAATTTHHDDTRLACEAFVARWPHLVSDIPAEPAVNHAVSSALVAGLSIDQADLALPSLVIGVGAGGTGRLPEPGDRSSCP